MLDKIVKWANDTSPAQSVYWLFGAAGTGKSTIPYTVARHFEFVGEIGSPTILGGNFFFSQQFDETKVVTGIIPIIAYHMALICKQFTDALELGHRPGRTGWSHPRAASDN